MAGSAPDTHLLRQLVLPARYEALVQRVGAEVAQLLVEPGGSVRDTLAAASVAARARGEGLFLPLVATSGTGKTTLTNNLATFLPNDFAATVTHTGEVAHDELLVAASDALPRPNDPRLVPINIDHREATPPSDGEVAEMKRFLREETVGSRCAIVWPQTSREQAEAMARAYVEVAGAQPVNGRDLLVRQVPGEAPNGPASPVYRVDSKTGAVKDRLLVGEYASDFYASGTADRGRFFLTSQRDNRTWELDAERLRVERSWPVGDLAGVVSPDGRRLLPRLAQSTTRRGLLHRMESSRRRLAGGGVPPVTRARTENGSTRARQSDRRAGGGGRRDVARARLDHLVGIAHLLRDRRRSRRCPVVADVVVLPTGRLRGWS